MGKGHEAIFNLNYSSGPVEIRENYGFSRRELGRIQEELNGNLQMLCEAWEKIHG
jgi:hypothetical protein